LGRKLLRASKWVLFTLGAIYALSPFAFMVLARRAEARLERALSALAAAGAPINAADLAGPPVPDEENAALVYEQAFEALALSDGDKNFVAEAGRGDVSLTDRAVAARARRILDRNARALSLLRRAAAMPRCAFPHDWRNPVETVFPELAGLNNGSRLLLLDSVMQARAGRLDKALAICGTALRLADAADEPTMLAQLVRYAVIARTKHALGSILRDSAPSEGACRALAGQMADIELSQSSIEALKGERAIGVSMFDHIRSAPDPVEAVDRLSCADGSGLPRASPPARAKHTPYAAIVRWWLASDELSYLRLMGLHIDRARLPYREVVSLRPSVEDELEKLAPCRRLSPPAVMTAILMPVFTKADLRRDYAIATLRVGRIALLLKTYRAREGAYPESLDSLADLADRAFSVDPFSAKPFRYERRGEGFIVYSIGPNLKDDGGKPRPRPKPAKQSPQGPSVVTLDEAAPAPPDDIVIRCTR
jgi:hypothetical protein